MISIKRPLFLSSMVFILFVGTLSGTFQKSPLLMATMTATESSGETRITVRNAAQVTQIGQSGMGGAERLEWLPNGKMLVASFTGGMLLYSADTLAKPLPAIPRDCRSFAISPDSAAIACQSDETHIEFWDVATGQKKQPDIVVSQNDTIGTGISSGPVMYSPDGTRFLYLTSKHGVVVVNLKTHSSYNILPTTRFWSFSIDPQSKIVALNVYSSTFNQVLLWDIAQGRVIKTLNGIDYLSADQIVFSPDDTTLAALSGVAQIWDIKTGKEIAVLKDSQSRFSDLRFSPAGDEVITASEDGIVRFWDTKTWTESRSFQVPYEIHVPPDKNSVLSLLDFSSVIAIYPAGDYFATGGINGIHLWDMKTFTEIAHDDSASDYSFEPKFNSIGSMVAALHFYRTSVTLLDAKSYLKVATLDVPTGTETADFSPDNQWLAVGTLDGNVQIWDMKTYKLSKTIKSVGAGQVFSPSIQFSPDGKLLALGSLAGGIQLWNFPDATPFATLADSAGSTLEGQILAFSPDGQTILSYNADGLKLWDVNTQTLVKEIKTKDRTFDVFGVAKFSPDGKTIATISINSGGAPDNKILFWDVQRGSLRSAIVINSPFAVSMAYNPDGSLLAVGDADGNISLWNISTLKQLAVLKGHFGPVESIAWQAQGTMLVSGSDDGTLRFWGIKGQ